MHAHRIAERALVDVGELLLQQAPQLVEAARPLAQQRSRRGQHQREIEARGAVAERLQGPLHDRLQRRPEARVVVGGDAGAAWRA